MAPKKTKQDASSKPSATAESPEFKKAETKASAPQKRKAETSNGETKKAPRRSGRGTTKSQPSQSQLLKFMLSPSAESLCRPEDESRDIESRGKIKTYSGSELNPFEELLCAIILSRPISHRLGLRTIRTVLNEPYNFNSARAVQKAGHEKHLQAVWDARTQHKDKTAEQIGMVADVVLEQFTPTGDAEGTNLRKAMDDHNNDVDAALDAMQKAIKGFGATGSKIFLRRVQWLWTDGYPYVDDRTQASLSKLGLPEDAAELAKVIEKDWKELGIEGSYREKKQRMAFVTVLERAIGADLEGKIDDLLEAAASA